MPAWRRWSTWARAAARSSSRMPETSFHISSMARLPPARRTSLLSRLTEAEADELIHDWRFFARPEQVAPPGSKPVWTYLAGRGAGKTRADAEWVREKLK